MTPPPLTDSRNLVLHQRAGEALARKQCAENVAHVERTLKRGVPVLPCVYTLIEEDLRSIAAQPLSDQSRQCRDIHLQY